MPKAQRARPGACDSPAEMSRRSNTRAGAAGLPFSGRPAFAVLAAVLAVLLAPSLARGDESPVPTSQQISYGAAWLPFVDPADLPPVEQRPVVCLVDSGVSVTPDLPADRPEGPIISRISAVDGEDATPGTAEENQHGTRMGLIIGAVQDGQGTVGAVPWARVISVKAMSTNTRSFLPGDYVRGASLCRQQLELGHAPLAAINFSLGCACGASQDESDALGIEVARLRQGGALVLASAGNSAGGAIGYPASQRGIVPVAAGDAGGGLCSYGSYGTQALLGPACAVDTAQDSQPVQTTGGGSSTASAFASALVAAVKTFRLNATSQDLEVWLRQGSRAVNGRLVIDAEGTFRAAGLGDVVDRAKARRAAAPASVATPQTVAEAPREPSVDGPRVLKVVTPSRAAGFHVRAQTTWEKGRLTVRLTSRRPMDAFVKIRLYRKKGKRFIPLRTFNSDSVRNVLRAVKRPDRVRVWLSFSDDTLSKPADLRLTSKGTYR